MSRDRYVGGLLAQEEKARLKRRVEELERRLRDTSSEYQAVCDEAGDLRERAKRSDDECLRLQQNIEDERKHLEEVIEEAGRISALAESTGKVAHDFKNYVSAMCGHARLMQRILPEDHPCQENLADIMEAGREASELSQKILTFGKRTGYEPRHLDVKEVVEEAKSFLGKMTDPKVKIISEMTGEYEVVADPLQLNRVLVNLGLNSAKAISGEGEVRISVEEVYLDRNQVLSNPEARKGNYVKISVEDDGCGMDEETKKKLFNPYFTTRDKGTGLGMSIVHGVVSRHKGIVTVDSEKGLGTKISCYFPEYEDVPAVMTRDYSGTETVLIADDEECIRRFVKSALEPKGYKVIPASDGEEAVRLYAERKDDIDLVLLDRSMPKMNGQQVLYRLHEKDPDVKVIMISGSGIYNDPVFDTMRILDKPFRVDELLSEVRYYLDL